MRKVVLNPNTTVTPCPKCTNNTSFEVYSSQVAIDSCNVWAVCGVCGFDPTDETNDRYEDVWGGVGNDKVMAALSCWNDAIREQEEHS